MLLCMPGPGLGAPPVRATGTKEQKQRFFGMFRDMENGGDADHTYRVNAGKFAYVTGFFPLGIQQGTAADIHLSGFGLGDANVVHVQTPAKAARGETIPIHLPSLAEQLLNAPRLAVGIDPEVTEADIRACLAFAAEKERHAVSTA